MSELKVTPMRPRTQAEGAAAGAGVAEERDEQGREEQGRDERDRIDPAELREEHEQRQHEQRKNIEGIDPETLLRMLYQLVLIRRFEE